MSVEINRIRSKIPEGARTVFKGILFSVHQWEIEVLPGQFKTWERLSRRSTAMVIPVTPEGKIVVSWEKLPDRKPFYTVVGGSVEEGETPLVAARRELLEEAGMEVGELRLWMVTEPDSNIDWSIYTFIGKDAKKVCRQNLELGEDITLMEMSFNDYINLTADRGYRDSHISLEVYRTLANPDGRDCLEKLFLG